VKIDWKFVALFLACTFAWLPFYAFGWNPRAAGWIFAALGAFGLMLRLVAEFNETPAGMRIACSLLLIGTGMRAWAQRNVVDNPNVPITWVSYGYISLSVMCIVFALYWPRWTDTKVSPFVRPKT
jgi:hypothetical protein